MATHTSFRSPLIHVRLTSSHCGLKLQKEYRISGLQNRKFRRPSSTPEARKERSYQSHHTSLKEESSFHRSIVIRPGTDLNKPAAPGTNQIAGFGDFCQLAYNLYLVVIRRQHESYSSIISPKKTLFSSIFELM